MATLSAQLKLAVFLLVKVYPPAQQFAYGLRGFGYNGAHGGLITQACAGIQRVGYVLLKSIIFTHHGGNTALRLG